MHRVVQESGINNLMNYGLYIHIPFCKRRCHYCDFNTYTGKEALIRDYFHALINELRIVIDNLTNIILTSIYFGGGTPSLIPIGEYETLINFIKDNFYLTQNCEISLEANPGTVSMSYLSGMREIGFNRISFGVQSTNPMDLIRLDRIHDNEDTLDAIYLARRAGFDNTNLDLIFNFPWQDLNSWRHSLTRAVDLAPEHFSLYSLIIEPGTPLHAWYQKGLIEPQNEDLEADMYELAMETLENAGYIHYEISNWAKRDQVKDYQCRHNMQYWLNKPYIGVGAGAHGYLVNIRTENVAAIDPYIQRLNSNHYHDLIFPRMPATISTLEVDKATQMKDFMWLGLRLVDQGVSLERFQNTYGVSADEVFNAEIEELCNLGLVMWGDAKHQSIKLTKKGVMLANQAFMRFI